MLWDLLDNSSIIKWDGIEWKPFTNVGGIKYGIYGFSDASFFVVGESSNRGLVAIWNGTQWANTEMIIFLHGEIQYIRYVQFGAVTLMMYGQLWKSGHNNSLGWK